MKLKDILKVKGSNVWTIKQNETVQEALHVLTNQNIGALLVLDEKGGIVGIISERDIVRGSCYNAKGIGDESVGQLMTRNVIIGSPEDEVSYIMGVMTQNRVRHIPVVAGGKLEGIVSIGDVVKSQLEAQEYEIHYLKEYIYGRGSTS